MLRRIIGGQVDWQTSRNNQMIVLALLIILSFPVLVESQSHGLTWGFGSGEKIYFNETQTIIDSNSTTNTLILRYYVVTRDNYTIPDPLTYFPLASEDTYFYNGTLLLAGRFNFAVPIGNWDLLEDTFRSIHSSSYDAIVIIDEEEYWGFQTTWNLTHSENSRTSIFSKSEGVLVSLLYEADYEIGHRINILIERVTPPLIIDNLVVMAGGSIIFIGLVSVYFFKRLRSSE